MSLLFNIAELKDLLRNFYVLTKIRIVIFDDLFHEIAAYPTRHSTYCHVIRSNPDALSRCMACDHEACLKCRRLQKLYTYRCHAGLTETVAPIVADRTVIGYLMFGQLLVTDNRTLLWDTIRVNLSAYDLDFNELRSAFMRKKIIFPQVIAASARMMEMAASYLYYTQKMTLANDALAGRIDRYIADHIAQDLRVPAICRSFGISKYELYQLSSRSFGMGLAEHVRQIRIHRAKALLTDTNLPVYEVAAQVGIHDYNYFTKVFKKETGVTPREYRRGR